MLEEDFWQDKFKSQKIIKEKKLYEDLIESFENSIRQLSDFDDLNELAIQENNTSIQNTTWNLGFINDKKYNYFRDYEQSQLWFPIEAKYFIENSKLNYSEFNLEYSGEVVIYQDGLRIFNEDSYDFLSNELISVDSTKDIIIEYKFKSFAASSSIPGYTYATLVMTDESGN